MVRTSICALVLALIAMIAVSPAFAATNCATRDTVIERLAAGYGETRQSVALAANNVVVETFASLSTGTWTLTITQPGGSTCIVASGQSFELVTESLAKQGEKL